MPLDLGIAEGIGARRYFVEAVGTGLVPLRSQRCRRGPTGVTSKSDLAVVFITRCYGLR